MKALLRRIGLGPPAAERHRKWLDTLRGPAAAAPSGPSARLDEGLDATSSTRRPDGTRFLLGPPKH